MPNYRQSTATERSVAAIVAALTLGFTAACHSGPPPAPPPPPTALTGAASEALAWVDAHALPFSITDSSPSAAERDRLVSFASGVRVLGMSELTEGTREFPLIVRHALFALADADSGGVRGLAIQGPMPEAMDVDRYVRTGVGEPKRLLHALGSWRYETPEMFGLVNAMREWNRGHASSQQIGFYGFEIGSGAHAVATVLALPDSITGAPLKAWLQQQYACVASDEAAHWGLEGRAADSSYWNACGTIVRHVADSVAALHARVTSPPAAAARVAYADQMARLIRHYVTTGLRHLPRQETNAAHVMYLADELGPNAQLLVWGGDVEMGRLTLDRVTVQTGVPLGTELGARYRAVAFAFGNGSVRTRRPANGRSGEPGGFGAITIRPPDPGTYEEVLAHAHADAYWLDLRSLPSDSAGTWLHGPRSMRLITELYAPTAPQLFETTLDFPKNFDAVVFVNRVTASR